ncbi:type II toxin-antitoxin system HicB family antitoxin [Pelagerythrobacter marensis]|uniref:Type II toxin-antitoxin system HicB family antitoxin n=1 Tax=Pelagerythrobacter marensis TaxID=543877 RepID=A0ABZ2D422_9SPHN
MPQQFYPAILYPSDQDGLFGVVVPGINVNVSASSEEAALQMAAAVLQDVIDDLASDDAGIPQPLKRADIEPNGGTIVLLPATMPGQSKRINITMDEDLIRRIDTVASNRSAFLASAARAQLAARG